MEKSLLSVATENTSEELKKLLKNKNIVKSADQILGKRLEEQSELWAQRFPTKKLNVTVQKDEQKH